MYTVRTSKGRRVLQKDVAPDLGHPTHSGHLFKFQFYLSCFSSVSLYLGQCTIVPCLKLLLFPLLWQLPRFILTCLVYTKILIKWSSSSPLSLFTNSFINKAKTSKANFNFLSSQLRMTQTFMVHGHSKLSSSYGGQEAETVGVLSCWF